MAYLNLSDQYNNTYIENIITFQKRAYHYYNEDEWFVDFYPSIGVKEGESVPFLFIGQAVGGWSTGFMTKKNLDRTSKISESKALSNRYCYEKDHSPLDWVNVSWTKSLLNGHMSDPVMKKHYEYLTQNFYIAQKSFFWNVAFKVVSDFHGYSRDDWDWAKKMVWSNLYKIAPDSNNPNYAQMQMQQPLASELIKMELDEMAPRYCVVLTNIDWWLPFSYHLNTEKINYNKIHFSEIKAVEKYKDTLILVTTRPRIGNGEIHAQQILSFIQQH